MQPTDHRFSAILLILAVTTCVPSTLVAQQRVDFNRDIRPLLSGKCLVCHGPDEAERAAGLRLDSADGSRVDLGGYQAIVPGDPDASELISRVAHADEEMRMPPSEEGPRLSADEIELLRRWIDQGGEFDRHWAYEKPTRPELPKIRQKYWARNPIDHFVLARLEALRLRHSPEADRLTLARRVAIDLTGLPPSWQEAVEFAEDVRADAYEKFVDRMLEKQSFGERWARVWLDLARYADSAGYADDPPRTIWAYRDYVIRSLNQNKPFDQFTIEQIAGDLLDNPTEQQLVATAFHRNTLTNNEGGTNDEEFRNVAVVDRVNTTMAVWMGTTVACAQCHNHKYDPISQEEYFQFFALLNNTEDSDKRDERPLLKIWTDEQEKQRETLQKRITELEAESKDGDPDPLAAKKEAEQKLAAIKPMTTVPIMRALPDDKQRTTRVQRRGNYRSLGAEVSPGTPAVFHPLPDDADRDRMALARWLVDDDNPLTARVIANRHWEEIFGVGIVPTSEEFGSQGELPSHPLLLDWLAVELRDSGWDLKHLLKLIVTSATYRQTSYSFDDLQKADPFNRWYARGPRFRISAEMVRDQALFVSGLLSDKMYGPPVKPPQPELGLKAAFGSTTDWKTSDGDDRYRRGIYTTWRRSSPYPSMAQFDAPNREVCTVRRIRTNTPLQALVTLNDPVYVEAAQALARQIIQAGKTTEARIKFAFQKCLIRYPSDLEVERLSRLLADTQKQFQSQPEAALQMATQPLGDLPKNADAAEYAAWTLVGNVILNLDEMLMKR